MDRDCRIGIRKMQIGMNFGDLPGAGRRFPFQLSAKNRASSSSSKASAPTETTMLPPSLAGLRLRRGRPCVGPRCLSEERGQTQTHGEGRLTRDKEKIMSWLSSSRERTGEGDFSTREKKVFAKKSKLFADVAVAAEKLQNS